MFRIATWNVNSLRVRLPHVLQWLDQEQPDVLAVQEIKLAEDKFPYSEIKDAGYDAYVSGQKTYNGVAILSKIPANNIIINLPDYNDAQRRVLCADINEITVLNLYVPNGSEVGSDKYNYKLKWFTFLHPFVKKLLLKNSRLLILGDFNIAPEDRDVHDPAEWEGKVLFSEPERSELRLLIKQGLVDCYRLFDQPPDSYSWWDYRAAAFRRNRGLRIDHILASKTLAEICQSCRIDKIPRKWDRPSDHAPVLAEFRI